MEIVGEARRSAAPARGSRRRIPPYSGAHYGSPAQRHSDQSADDSSPIIAPAVSGSSATAAAAVARVRVGGAARDLKGSHSTIVNVLSSSERIAEDDDTTSAIRMLAIQLRRSF